MKNLTIRLVDQNYKCDSLNRKNMELYLSANEQIELMKDTVIAPFEAALKESLGYDDGNIPLTKATVEKRVGSHRFVMEVKPTNKPAYAPVFNKMDSYLKNLEIGSEQRKNRYGVRTIEGQAYASIDDTVEMFSQLMEDSMQPSVDIKIEKKNDKAGLVKKIMALNFDVSEDYSKLNNDNASRYIIAKTLADKVKKQITSPFEKEVKASIGFDEDNLPEGVQYTKQIVGDVMIFSTNSSADSVKYAPIVDGMIDYLDNMQNLVEPGERSSVPEIRKFNDRAYLSIEAMRGKFKQLKSKNTKDTLRQSISYLKLPKDDKVLIG